MAVRNWPYLGGAGAVVLATSVAAAQPPQSPEAQLAGTSGRDWVLKGVNQWMSTDNRCSGSGETFRFTPDRKVRITRCVSGTIQRSSANWRLRSTGPLDFILTIAGVDYGLSFSGGTPPQMRLRKRGQGIATLAVDRIYNLSDD